MIINTTPVTVDNTMPCDQRWLQAKNGYPYNALVSVDGVDRVRNMYIANCCQQKGEALFNVYGADVVAQFKAACINSNGTLNDPVAFAKSVAGGPEGLLGILGIDFGGGTGRIDENKSSIIKAVAAFVLLLVLIFVFWKIWS